LGTVGGERGTERVGGWEGPEGSKKQGTERTGRERERRGNANNNNNKRLTFLGGRMAMADLGVMEIW
jgi:hypothetical protein